MIEALVAILCGLLLLSSLFRAEAARLAGALKPFETMTGVIAVVVGILAITSFRPFLRYTGPRWLVGASIFPYAGAIGITALMLVCGYIWLSYGGW